MKKQMKTRKQENAITLIALVITIIVLLILASIAISLVTGENGIIPRSIYTRTKHAHTTLFESMQLAYNDYQIEKNTENENLTLIQYLLKREIITKESEDNDKVWIINVNKLLTKLSLGNGSNGQDVYKLEEITGDSDASEKEYIVKYYGNEEKDNTQVGKLNDISSGSLEFDLAPGLYEEETNNLIKSWDELIADNNIKMEGSILTIIGNIQKGKLIISRDVTQIRGTGSTCLRDIDITEVYIPSSVKRLEYFAFADMHNELKINIEEGLEYIGENVFCYSTLKDLVLPDSLKEIDKYGLYCVAIKSNKIKIPKNVEKIGDEALCLMLLEDIEVDKDNKNYTSENGVLFNKDMTELLAYPCGKEIEYVIPATVKKIGNRAFYSSYAKNVVMQSGVTDIGDYAFSEAINLEIPMCDTIERIGEGAYMMIGLARPQMEELIIPSSVKIIEKDAFSMVNIKNITIPNSVKTMGWCVFGNSNIETINVQFKESEIPSTWDEDWIGYRNSGSNLEVNYLPES